MKRLRIEGLTRSCRFAAALAVEMLIGEKSLPHVLEYFNSFATSKDREQSFTGAFGEETLAFEGKFDNQLRKLLGK